MRHLTKFLTLFIAVLMVFSACRREDNNVEPVPVEDGYYLVGGSVANDSMKLSGMMEPGYVEGDGFAAVLREGMFQKYFYGTQAGGGFIVMQRAGADTITWGMSGDWTVVRQDSVYKCNIAKNGGTNFTLPSDGFYLFVIDINLMKAYLVKVHYWAVIGSATNGGWSDDSQQKFTVINLDKFNGEWKIENLVMFPGDYKFRFNSWWTYYDADPGAADNGDPKFFTNLGGDLTKLTPGGGNLSINEAGIYTIDMNYVLGEGFTATVTYISEAPFDDISQDTISLIGNGIAQLVNGDTVWSSFSNPEIDLDLTYTGTNNGIIEFSIDSIVLTDGGLFKFRMNHAWDRAWGYGDVTVSGDAADIDGVDDGFGGLNFHSNSNKIYNIKFQYNGYTRKPNIDFQYIADYTPPVQDNPSLHLFSFIGSAFYSQNDPNNSATNWNEDLILTYQNQDQNGNYVFVYNGLNMIGGGEFKIRMDTAWTVNYGWSAVNGKITGDAANFELGTENDNIRVINNATYNVTLVIDGSYQLVSIDFTAVK